MSQDYCKAYLSEISLIILKNIIPGISFSPKYRNQCKDRERKRERERERERKREREIDREM